METFFTPLGELERRSGLLLTCGRGTCFNLLLELVKQTKELNYFYPQCGSYNEHIIINPFWFMHFFLLIDLDKLWFAHWIWWDEFEQAWYLISGKKRRLKITLNLFAGNYVGNSHLIKTIRFDALKLLYVNLTVPVVLAPGTLPKRHI